MKATSRRDFLCWTGRCALWGAGALSLASLMPGCKAMEVVSDVGSQLGASSGVISHSQAQSIQKSGRAVARSFEDFTSQQEYYIGRTVGAMVLQKYPAYPNQAATAYVNLLGQTMASASRLPETYGGYHFLILDSDEINALAAPGGLVFLTRGMLRCCPNEDALAGVLAHEVGHVEMKHGLQAIKKSRVTSALTTIGMEGAKSFGSQELSTLTSTFEDSITDITGTMINNGYSRGFEREADAAAVTTLDKVGYDPNGMVDMLETMQGRLKPGGLDFAKTHPSPQSRVSDIQEKIGGYAPVMRPEDRQKRFLRAMENV